jgi:hypothetical protein
MKRGLRGVYPSLEERPRLWHPLFYLKRGKWGVKIPEGVRPKARSQRLIEGAFSIMIH